MECFIEMFFRLAKPTVELLKAYFYFNKQSNMCCTFTLLKEIVLQLMSGFLFPDEFDLRAGVRTSIDCV